MTQVSGKATECPRVRELRDEREPRSGVAPLEPMRLFAQLLARDDHAGGSAASLASARVVSAVSGVEALTEQLTPRITACAQWPLQVVLHLPHLGRINASVRREQGAWNIELDAQEEATARWLSGVRQQCEGRLARVLDAPVNLLLPSVGSA
ncbi:type III secretion system HrpP C-terminal domain-containing protein [Pseudomonas sp. SDO5271_S396]